MPVKDVSIVKIISRYVKLKPLGPHMIGKCPFHNDQTASLTVTESKDLFKCFGCGEAGDCVDFVMKFKKLGYKEALKLVREKPTDLTPIETKRPEPARQLWRQIRPQWNPNFVHPEFGTPSKRWAYRDADGDVLGYDCRFDLPDGSKMVLPYAFFSNRTMKAWRWQGFDAPRPLFNLHHLHHGKPVLIVEGCKTAQFASDLIGAEYSVVTWQGGANGVEKTDFKPLAGMVVYLWPDNDKEARYGSKYHPRYDQLKPFREQPGNAAMIQIGREVKAKSIFWVRNEADLPNKWDVADWTGATGGDIISYINENSKIFKP